MSFIDVKHIREGLFSKIDNSIPANRRKTDFTRRDEFIAPIIVQFSPETSHSLEVACDGFWLTAMMYSTFEIDFLLLSFSPVEFSSVRRQYKLESALLNLPCRGQFLHFYITRI